MDPIYTDAELKTFLALPVERRREITKLLDVAHSTVKAGEPPADAIKNLADALREIKLPHMADAVWEVALKRPVQGRWKSTAHLILDRLEKVLDETDQTFLQAHRNRSHSQADQAWAGMPIIPELARAEWMTFYAKIDPKNLREIIQKTARYLKTLPQDERHQVLKYLSTHELKYLPESTAKVFFGVIQQSLIQNLLKMSLLLNEDGTVAISSNLKEIERELCQIYRIGPSGGVSSPDDPPSRS